MRLISILALCFLYFLPLDVFARCSAFIALPVLSTRYSDNNCAEKILNKIKEEKKAFYSSLSTEVCNNGCSLRPNDKDCMKQSSTALSGVQEKISAVASELGCSDGGEYRQPLSQDFAQSSTPDSACYWLNREKVKVTCSNEEANTNMCGVGGQAICVGRVACTSQFELNGTPIQAGVYSLSCLIKEGECKDITLKKCMNDRHTETVSRESYRINESYQDQDSSVE